MRSNETKPRWHTWFFAAGLGGLWLATGTGCQVDVGGQTLPSPYYWQDDVQFYPAGPEFKLSNEAAAMKMQREQQELDLR